MNNEERIRVMDNFCFGSAARVGFEQQGARDVGVAGAGFEKQGAQGVQDFTGGAGGNVGAGAQGARMSSARQGAGCVVLCADIDCVNHPEIIGLGGENLTDKRWLCVVCDAKEARESLRRMRDVAEVWVVSCVGASPINLAASIKHDSRTQSSLAQGIPDMKVFLVSSEKSGSLLSRSNTAGIDGVLTIDEFVHRYRSFNEPVVKQARDIVNSGVDTSGVYSGAHAGVSDFGSGVAVSGFSGSAGANGVGVSAMSGSAAGTNTQPESNLAPNLEKTEIMPTSAINAALASSGGSQGGNADRPDTSATGVTLSKGADRMGSSTLGGATSLGSGAHSTSNNQAFLLPIVSGSGGSGKSTVAALAALIAQQSGLKTLLLDFDLQFGDMRETVGAKEAMHVEDLIEAPMRIQHVQPTADMPAILSIPRNLELSEQVEKQLPELLDLLQPNFDIIIVNTGAYWSEHHAVLLERCSRALFLVDQRPASLRACQRALQLCARCGIATSQLIFAVNKCSKQGLYSSIDVSCALHGAVAKELMWGGPAVEEYIAAGQAMELLDTRNAFVASLSALLYEIVPHMNQLQPVSAQHAKPSFLRMFMNRAGVE